MAVLSPLHRHARQAVPAAPVEPVSRFQAASIGAWVDEKLQEDDHILTANDPRAHGKRRILRQPVVNRFVHWAIALSTFSLFFSGFGQMPLYKRYMLSDVPYMAWTADYSVTLMMHYVGALVLLFALGMALTWLFRRAEAGSPHARLLYATMLSGLVMSGFGEYFFMNLSFYVKAALFCLVLYGLPPLAAVPAAARAAGVQRRGAARRLASAE